MNNKTIAVSPATAIKAPISLLEGVLISALISVYFWVFWTSFSSMAANGWNKDTFAHAPLIPIISAWLIWRKRVALFSTPLGSSTLSLLMIVIGSGIWLTGIATDIAVLQQLAAVGIFLWLIPLVFGLKITYVLLFPLAYLLFMVPIGEEIVPALQQITADITVALLRASSVPVYINGLYIEIPSGKFEVAKACSGVRYLIAGLAVGSLYAYLNYQRLRTQLLFMLIAVLVPIIANGIRAYLIVLIAHLSDMQYAVGADHLVYGWVFFGMVMFLMFWIGSFWTDPAPSSSAISTQDNERLAVPRTALILITLLFFGGLNYAHSRLTDSPLLTALPPYSLQLEQPEQPATDSDWDPFFAGADRRILQRFKIQTTSTPMAVGVFIADYQTEYQGKELINQSNRVNPYDNWTRKSEHQQSLVIADITLPLIITEWRHISGDKRRTWHLYRAYGQLSNSPLKIKFMQALNKLSGTNDVSTVFAFAIDYEDDTQATQLLQTFLQTHWLSIETQHQQSIPSVNNPELLR